MGKSRFRIPLDPYYMPGPNIALRPVDRCILCGGRRSVLWKRIGPWRLWRCVGCDLCYLNPRPSAEALYEDYHERLHIEDAPTPEAIQRGIAAWDARVEWIVSQMARLSPRMNPGRALDLGCASGFFLANLQKRGWDVTGCELAAWAAQRARQLFGFPVFTGDILTADLPRGFFDLVTLWDVIEHVPDPRAVLAKARDWAKSDGLIVVRVPNASSLDARTLGVGWIDWCLPYHFYHFTPKTLAALARRSGLEVHQIEAGVSTVLWRFLFLPLAMPGHHVKVLAALRRFLPEARPGFLLRWYERLGARYMPGPTLTMTARPK